MDTVTILPAMKHMLQLTW